MKLLLLQAPFFWGSLLWLCFLLAGEGTKGPNRFGEATREAPSALAPGECGRYLGLDVLRATHHLRFSASAP